jgi:osmotically-inducible protein OsmY
MVIRKPPAASVVLMERDMTDAEIRDAVLRELAWDSRVDEAAVGVTVQDRIVTLSGYVRSDAEKMAAQEAAHHVRGVLDVANDIIVKVPFGLGHTDTDLAGAVRHALEWDVDVPDTRIRSTVYDGWVTLEGDVDRLRQREDAERAVRRLSGVRGIENKIVVVVPAIAPERIREAIEAALARQASREARRIDVSVSDGVVTLSGLVGSSAERRAIRGVVSHARGVRAVNDQLRTAG